MKILLVEDEQRMADALAEILRLEKYEVETCGNGTDAVFSLESSEFDIIILDVMLPGKSGFEVAKEARKNGVKTPILMLTAKSQLDDKVYGLDSGADDYLTKPFMTKELLARLRALTRRSANMSDHLLAFGDLELNTENYTLTCTANGNSIRLKEKEYRILEFLLINQGRVLTREQLSVRIWGYNSEAEYNNVAVYLSFTRKKLLFIGSAVKIKAVRGLGYELRCDNVQENTI